MSIPLHNIDVDQDSDQPMNNTQDEGKRVDEARPLHLTAWQRPAMKVRFNRAKSSSSRPMERCGPASHSIIMPPSLHVQSCRNRVARHLLPSASVRKPRQNRLRISRRCSVMTCVHQWKMSLHPPNVSEWVMHSSYIGCAAFAS